VLIAGAALIGMAGVAAICKCKKKPKTNTPNQAIVITNTAPAPILPSTAPLQPEPQLAIQMQPMVQLVPPPVQMLPVAQPIQQASPVMAQPVGGSAASAAMAAQQQRVQSLGGDGGGSSGANLETMTVKELRGIAAAQGVSPDDIENARDGDNPRQDLIALIKSSSAVADLDSMTVKELRGIAAEQGVSADDIERARDGNNPKQDLIALIKGRGMLKLKLQGMQQQP
jgi:hypothetical protein